MRKQQKCKAKIDIAPTGWRTPKAFHLTSVNPENFRFVCNPSSFERFNRAKNLGFVCSFFRESIPSKMSDDERQMYDAVTTRMHEFLCAFWIVLYNIKRTRNVAWWSCLRITELYGIIEVHSFNLNDEGFYVEYLSLLYYMDFFGYQNSSIYSSV